MKKLTKEEEREFKINKIKNTIIDWIKLILLFVIPVVIVFMFWVWLDPIGFWQRLNETAHNHSIGGLFVCLCVTFDLHVKPERV